MIDGKQGQSLKSKAKGAPKTTAEDKQELGCDPGSPSFTEKGLQMAITRHVGCVIELVNVRARFEGCWNATFLSQRSDLNELFWSKYLMKV